jgi:hypothetical protein
LLLAVQRTDPPDADYYFNLAAARGGGFDTTAFFGHQVGQGYRIYLLIMNEDEARQFFDDHQKQDGAFAVARHIPSQAERADSASVRQTTMDCDE